MAHTSDLALVRKLQEEDFTDTEDDSLPSSGAKSSAKACLQPPPSRPRQQQQQRQQPRAASAAVAATAAAAAQPSDAIVRVSVGGGGGARALKQQQQQGLGPKATSAEAGLRQAKGQRTPLAAAPLSATGLSPLLSPTLANLFMPGGGAAGPIDLNADLEHLLGDFDFSNDEALMAGQVAKPAGAAALALAAEPLVPTRVALNDQVGARRLGIM